MNIGYRKYWRSLIAFLGIFMLSFICFGKGFPLSIEDGFVIQDLENGKINIHQVDISTGEGENVVIDVGGESNNAFGFNPVDGYIYGVQKINYGEHNLLKIGKNGTEYEVTKIPITGLEKIEKVFVADFDRDGNFWVGGEDGLTREAFKIDVDSGKATLKMNLNRSMRFADWAYTDKVGGEERFYFVADGKLGYYKKSGDRLQEGKLNITDVGDNRSIVGTFMAGTTFFFYPTESDVLYKIDLNNPGLGITFGRVPKSLDADGARNYSIKAPESKVSVIKSVDVKENSFIKPGETVEYTLDIKNEGNFDFTGYILRDDLLLNNSGLEDRDIGIPKIVGTDIGIQNPKDMFTGRGLTLTVKENSRVTVKYSLTVPEEYEGIEIKNIANESNQVTVKVDQPLSLRHDIFEKIDSFSTTVKNLPRASEKNRRPPLIDPGKSIYYIVTIRNMNSQTALEHMVDNDYYKLYDRSGKMIFKDIQFAGGVFEDKNGVTQELRDGNPERVMQFFERNGVSFKGRARGGINQEKFEFASIPQYSSLSFILKGEMAEDGSFEDKHTVESYSALNGDNPSGVTNSTKKELRRTEFWINGTLNREENLGRNKLLLRKSAEKDEVTVGDLVPYRIVVKNVGDSLEREITIEDKLPPGFSFQKDSAYLVDSTTEEKRKLQVTGENEISMGTFDLSPGKEIEVSYLLKVGVGVKPGKYKNIASAVNSSNLVSNSDEADVEVIHDLVFDSTTIIGKVFHDRDGDGIQDYADSRDVRVQIEVDGQIEERRIDKIPGRISEMESPENNKVVIVKGISNIDSEIKIGVKTKNGTELTLYSSGEVVTNHRGDKVKGFTSEEIEVRAKIIRNKEKSYHLEISILNLGIQEEGIPGVRVASPEGIVMETDRYGRFHSPIVTSEKGKNYMLKVDSATLPEGTVFTTSNPKVNRLGKVMMRYNFGVKFESPENR